MNAVVTPTIMKTYGLTVKDYLSESIFLQLFKEVGISASRSRLSTIIREENKKELLETETNETIRKLESSDAEVLNILFLQFRTDLDDAYERVRSLVVYGAFEDGKLVCIKQYVSMGKR